eukprot:14820011-Ditylum_brightwellii.AAC.1
MGGGGGRFRVEPGAFLEAGAGARQKNAAQKQSTSEKEHAHRADNNNKKELHHGGATVVMVSRDREGLYLFAGGEHQDLSLLRKDLWQSDGVFHRWRR